VSSTDTSSCCPLEFDRQIVMLSMNQHASEQILQGRACVQYTTNMRASNHTLCVTIARNGLQNTDMRSALMFVFVKTLQGWAYRKQPNARCMDERPACVHAPALASTQAHAHAHTCEQSHTHTGTHDARALTGTCKHPNTLACAMRIDNNKQTH
jgi:hypothetical protein